MEEGTWIQLFCYLAILLLPWPETNLTCEKIQRRVWMSDRGWLRRLEIWTPSWNAEKLNSVAFCMKSSSESQASSVYQPVFYASDTYDVLSCFAHLLYQIFFFAWIWWKLVNVLVLRNNVFQQQKYIWELCSGWLFYWIKIFHSNENSFI